MRNPRCKIIVVCVVCITIVCCYFIADYINLLSLIGLDDANINWDIASIVIGNIVIIALFLSTYFLLDRRKINKENNQRKTAILTLQSIYDACLETVFFFSSDKFAEKAARNCDFSKLVFQDPIIQHYLNLPFDNHVDIVDFAKSGIITDEEYKLYLKIRDNFKNHMHIRIGLFDCKEFKNYKKDDLISDIQKAKEDLKSKKEV